MTNQDLHNAAQISSFGLVEFFSNMLSHILDTYMITLMASKQINQRNTLDIKEKDLIQCLHKLIADMYQRKMIDSLHSSLKSTIKAALDKFSNLGLIVGSKSPENTNHYYERSEVALEKILHIQQPFLMSDVR